MDARQRVRGDLGATETSDVDLVPWVVGRNERTEPNSRSCCSQIIRRTERKTKRERHFYFSFVQIIAIIIGQRHFRFNSLKCQGNSTKTQNFSELNEFPLINFDFSEWNSNLFTHIEQSNSSQISHAFIFVVTLQCILGPIWYKTPWYAVKLRNTAGLLLNSLSW